MVFDWTINLGHVFTAMGFLAFGLGIYYALRFDVKILTRDVGQLGGRMINVENELREVSKLLAELVRYDEKFTNVDARNTALTTRLADLERRINDLFDRPEVRRT